MYLDTTWDKIWNAEVYLINRGSQATANNPPGVLSKVLLFFIAFLNRILKMVLHEVLLNEALFWKSWSEFNEHNICYYQIWEYHFWEFHIVIFSWIKMIKWKLYQQVLILTVVQVK